MIISSNSKTLYTGGDDFTIKEWDLATGTLKYTLYGHQGSV
jgi:WD40 repeat protein